MKKSLRAICFGVSFLSCAGMFAQSVKELVPSFAYDVLVENGVYKKIHATGADDYVLLPESEFKNDCETNRVIKKGKKNYPFVAELLFKIDKEELKILNNSVKDNFTISDVSKIMRSISKMKGMTYYSTTRKKRVLLYKNAYTIESEQNPIAIPDVTEGSANNKLLFGFLDDASFGPCKYKLAYFENAQTLYARFTNLDTMGLGIIKAIYPGDMIINLLVIDCGDCFLLYLGTDTDCIKFPGIASQLEDSLVSRLNAIYDWFLHQF